MSTMGEFVAVDVVHEPKALWFKDWSDATGRDAEMYKSGKLGTQSLSGHSIQALRDSSLLRRGLD